MPLTSPWHLPPFLLLTQAIFQVVVLLPSNFPLKVTFHLSYFNEAHKTFEIASSLHSVHMNHCSVVTLPVEQDTERDTKEERK